MKTLNIAKRIIRQIINDKRSLALILIAPVFIFTLIYLLLGNSDYKANIAESGLQPQIIEYVENQGITVDTLAVNEGKEQVKDSKIDAFLYNDGNGIRLVFRTYDAVKTGLIQKSIANAMKELSTKSSVQVEYIYGESSGNLFENIGYVMLGIIAFFIIFIIAGVSFVKERTNQTMERLMMTPVRRWQVMLGYTLGFGFFAMLQSIILLAYAIWVLHMTVSGSAVMAGIIMVLLAMSAVCIGSFFSIFSNSEFQMMQFIPIVVIPQIFFSGLISLDTLPYHLGLLSKIMPVYYACSALKNVMIIGGGLSDIWPDLLALFAFILLFSVLNILTLKKYRKI
ncbi:MAG: ABC transporter permease [Bacillota bacterium]|nr:ABC transporter permease [Bacillota bacterium]